VFVILCAGNCLIAMYYYYYYYYYCCCFFFSYCDEQCRKRWVVVCFLSVHSLRKLTVLWIMSCQVMCPERIDNRFFVAVLRIVQTVYNRLFLVTKFCFIVIGKWNVFLKLIWIPLCSCLWKLNFFRWTGAVQNHLGIFRGCNYGDAYVLFVFVL
jgi:hypothetical protein